MITAILRARAPPPLTIAGTGATALSTASTVALSVEPQDHARAHRATPGMKVTIAILRACAPRPLTRARTDQMEVSIASTVELSVEPQGRAFAHHATQDMKE